nr:hypothetical protein [Tanacetum cinerariifolium]
MVEELNVINTPKKGDTTVDAFTEVMGAMAHCDRSPVLLFIGGGMGAGKSTALKEILKEIASSLLVTTLNDGRDVIMDGTLSWELFVEQTIAMARSVHKHRYRMGVVYKVSDDGTITENYWEKVEDEEDDFIPKTPYKIEMLGVVCDPYLVVTRGIRVIGPAMPTLELLSVAAKLTLS